jgi:hypothetical protein
MLSRTVQLPPPPFDPVTVKVTWELIAVGVPLRTPALKPKLSALGREGEMANVV